MVELFYNSYITRYFVLKLVTVVHLTLQNVLYTNLEILSTMKYLFLCTLEMFYGCQNGNFGQLPKFA